jgi:alpha-galactosidase
MSTSQIVFGAASFEVASHGQVSKIGAGYIFSGPELEILHKMNNPEFYRHGWNSWSPTGWRKITEKPLKIYGNPLRLLTADDSQHFHEGLHAGSGVGALSDINGKVLLVGALTVGNNVIIADEEKITAQQGNSPSEWFVSKDLKLKLRNLDQFGVAGTHFLKISVKRTYSTPLTN